MIIKHIDVMSAGKVSGIIAAAIGLLAGLLFLLFGSMMSGIAGAENGGMLAAVGGAMGVVLLPILYAVIGFIGGVLQAFVYNLAARFVGGIRIETE